MKKNWCCKECYKEERKYYYKNKDNLFNNLFNNYYSDNYNYYFEKEKKQTPLNIDWENLNLNPPKTLKQIKKQYRLLCLKHHPDKGGNSQDFIKITDSYNNLII